MNHIPTQKAHPLQVIIVAMGYFSDSPYFKKLFCM